jgi:kynureninase
MFDSREELANQDAEDPLRHFRDAFHVPRGVTYLDGNSLGPLPHATRKRLHEVIEREWGEGLIRSWNDADWIGLPRRVGDKIARLIGAREGEVIAADSTSVNLFKVLSTALAIDPRRAVLLTEQDNFPTDLYILEGVVRATPGRRLERAEGEAGVLAALEEHGRDVAAVVLTQANYRTGRLLDMRRVNEAAHAAGALAVWDLSHSAGALPVDLDGCEADFAVGCGYKYLNGGPGAPAYLYVATRWQLQTQPLSGWMGHAAPFHFAPRYEPARGIGRYLCGTPSVLAMTALECAVDLMLQADMGAVRHKSVALADAFIALVERNCPELELISPREASERGSQVSFRHPESMRVMQALIARGVIGDCRPPDVLRFGFAPLYVRFVDVWDAAAGLCAVLSGGEWKSPRFAETKSVT